MPSSTSAKGGSRLHSELCARYKESRLEANQGPGADAQDCPRYIFDLGLNTLLTDAKIFFPERTLHLYQILVALDLKIEKCSSGVSSMSPHILAYYEKIVRYFYLLLDSVQHENISDELDKELTDGFIAAVSDAAFEGKANVLHRKNALAIFMYLDLSDLAPRFDMRFPERNERGFFIMTGENKEEDAA